MTHPHAHLVSTARMFAFVWLVILSHAEASTGQQRKSVREDLAEAQRLGNYSLADVWKPSDKGVWVVSVADRGGKWIKTRHSLATEKLYSPDGKSELFYRNGLWLRNLQSGEERMVDPKGHGRRDCWAPDGRRFVFDSSGMVRVFDVEMNSATDLVEGEYPSWSPDGNWIAFGRKGACYLISPSGAIRGRPSRVIKSKYGAGTSWSPDGRFLTYTKTGGPSGGFLFWGIKCIEPYRVWVVRVQDGASDWVQNTCKPGFTFGWVKNSDLVEP